MKNKIVQLLLVLQVMSGESGNYIFILFTSLSFLLFPRITCCENCFLLL